MITVAVTGCGSAAGHTVLRSLQYAPQAVRTVGVDPSPAGVGLHWVDVAYIVPAASDERAYIERLLEICRAERVELLIPGSDPELIPLARHQELFLREGTRVLVGSPAAVELARDKWALAEYCRARGLPFVETWLLEDARQRIAELAFPVIAKPRSGSGSVGVRLVHDPEDLLRIPPDAEFIVQRYMPPLPPVRPGSGLRPGTAVPGGEASLGVPTGRPGDGLKRWLQRLDQRNECSSLALIGPSGRVLGCCTSVNRLKDGVPMEVVPYPAPSPEEVPALARAMAEAGMRGPLGLSGRSTPDGVRFYEINARFIGSTSARAALGFRAVGAAIWAFALDREDEAERCLGWTASAAVIRHADDTVVPKEGIARLGRARGIPEAPPPMPMPRRVLLTGASEPVGASLVELLRAAPGVEEVRTLTGTEDEERLSGAMEGIEAVVHLAELRPAPPIRPEELYAANAEGTRRLASAARGAGVARMVYLSSTEVYGSATPPWSETQAPRPETAYGQSKLAGEMLCADGAAIAVILRAGDASTVDLRGAILRAVAMPLSPGQPLVLNVGSGPGLDTRRIRARLGWAPSGRSG